MDIPTDWKEGIWPYDVAELEEPLAYCFNDDNHQPTSQVERTEAKYNRMVIMNVSKWHRVTPISSGARFAFAVNIWKERPPPLENFHRIGNV